MTRIITWSVVYLCAIGIVMAACYFVIPDLKTNSVHVAFMWERGDKYFTDWLPTSNLVAYTLCNGFGFLFVSHVTMNRSIWFKSQN